MFPVDQCMIFVLLPIIGISVLQPSWIEPKKRIMCKEKRAAIIKTKRQFNTIEFSSIFKIIAIVPIPDDKHADSR